MKSVGDPAAGGYISPFYPTSLYSLRKRNSVYTGHCLRVQRSSDSTTLDIDFDAAGWVNYAAILTFCAGTNGFVTIFYDQSGGGVNLVGSGMQIVTSGSLTATSGGKGMIVALAASTSTFSVAANAAFAFGTAAWTWEAFTQPTASTSGSAQVILDFRDVSNSTALYYAAGGNIPTYFDGSNHNNGVGSIVNNTFNHSGCSYSGGVGGSMRVFYIGNIQDTETLSPSFSGNRPFSVAGGFNATLYWSGLIAEIRITKGANQYTGGFTPPDFFA